MHLRNTDEVYDTCPMLCELNVASDITSHTSVNFDCISVLGGDMFFRIGPFSIIL